NKALTITLKDERKGQQKEETFFYKGGLAEFVKHLLGNRKSLHPKPIVFETTREGVVVEGAIQYDDGYNDNTLSFVNNINTHERGVHPHGGRHPRRPDRRAARQGQGSAVRRADQDQTRQLRSRGDREDRRQRRPGRFLRQEPERGAHDHRQGGERGAGARGGAQGARAGPQKERARGGPAPRQARRVQRERSQADRAVSRRGGLGRRLRQTGTGSHVPGHPAAASQ